jgi:polysaccharide pyruvyl transferase WcaK-like protein
VPGNLSPRYPINSTSNSLTFFLSGYYGQGNLGDDLLLRATIEGICRIAPVRRFVIRNEGDVAGLKDLPVPIELTGIDRIAADQTKSKAWRLVSSLVAYRRHLTQCDWFVFGGGTVFHERSSVVALAMTFLVCLLARLLGVRIAALGVGVATISSKTGRFLLRCIIALSDVFAVRDDAAVAECMKAQAGSRVVLTADLVFTIAKSLRGAGKTFPSTEAPIVGISVYSPALSHPVTGDRVSAIMREVLETILVRGWRVVLLAFHYKREGSNAQLDQGALMQLTDSLSAEYSSQIQQVALDAANLAGIYDAFSKINVHCGMRFHGHVLSAVFEKPFVGIAVDNKIDAICRLFDMPVVQLDRLRADDVVNSIDQAMASRVNPALLAACEEAAAKNFSQLAARLAVLQPALP